MSIDPSTAAARGVDMDGDPPTSVTPAGSDREGGGAAPGPDFRGKGRLLEEPKGARVCQAVERLWKAQNPRMKPILAQWDANRLTMDGVPGVRAVKDVDTDTYYARVPIGASAVRVGISKAKELVHKTTATLLVDPPQPDCQPSPDDQGDLAKAELCTRILKNECVESGLDLHRLLEDASNLSGTYGSGFLVLEMDPAGGGWTPLAIDAHPAATHYDPADPDAVLRPPPPAEGDPADPLAAEEVDPQPPVPRYLAKRPPARPGEEAAADGPVPLTDDPREAEPRWQLKLRADVVTGRQLRLLPALARGIDDADGVLLARVTTFGALRGAFPEIDGWNAERQRALMTWRPVPLKDVLPPGYVLDGDGTQTITGDDDPRAGLPADEALCFTFRLVYRSHPAYPDGAEILCAGQSEVLHKDTRCVWVGGEGADDPPRPECLDLNVVQVRRYTDPTGANPYGIADAELLAPGDDLRAQLLADAVETIWRVNHPHLLLPLGSTIDAGRLGERDDTPILYNAASGRPEWEQPPGMDPNTLGLYQAVGREMDSRSGLEDAQRLNSPNITSGKQAETIQEQALTTLSPLNRNLKAAFARACRVILQLYRAYATQPMLLRYTGEDGRYVVKEFVNTDLGSARDVRIAAGTSTMLSQTAKASLAAQDLQIAIQANDVEGGYRRYRQAMQANLDPQLGRDQDPHHQRVMRQIHAWRAGPPAGQEMPPAPAMPTVPPGDPSQLPPQGASGMVGAPPPPDPMQTPDPRALALFAPWPVDAQPDVAKTRALALGDELARETTETLAQRARPWVLALVAAYQQAAHDAGFTTRAEQEQQQAQAAQQQQEAQAQQAQAAQQADAQKLAAQAQEKDADRAAGIEKARIQASSRGAPVAA